MPAKEKVVLSWSGGKDSAMALYELQHIEEYEVVSLLTTVASEYNRVSHHGVRAQLLEAQAAATSRTSLAWMQRSSRSLSPAAPWIASSFTIFPMVWITAANTASIIRSSSTVRSFSNPCGFAWARWCCATAAILPTSSPRTP